MKTQLSVFYPFYTSVGTYPIHILGIFLVFMTACSVFKEKSFFQADSLLRRDEKLEFRAAGDSHIKLTEVYSSEDSADKQYSVEISPKGLFKFSLNEGFSGEAERLLLKGRTKEGKKQRDSAAHSQTSRLDLAAKSSESSRIHGRVKEKDLKSDYSHFYYLAGCLTVLILGFVFRRFLDKPAF